MNQRTLSSINELTALLNSALRKKLEESEIAQDHPNVQIDGIRQLDEPDGEGCNWSLDIIVSNPDGLSPSIIYGVVNQFRQTHNLVG